MFISAFYDNKEFVQEDQSEGFSSNASDELNFQSAKEDPRSPDYDQYKTVEARYSGMLNDDPLLNPKSIANDS